MRREPAVVGAPLALTRPAAVLTTSAVRPRAVASGASRRCSRASTPIAASTRATIAAIRAARTHSSVSRTAAQPRSTDRAASATSPRHSANDADAR